MLCFGTIQGSILAEEQVYKFSVPPWQKTQSDEDTLAGFRPIFKWIGEQVGAQFVLIAAKDYQQASNFLADGAVELSYLGPAGFVAAERKNPGVKMLVTQWRWDETRTKRIDSYTSLILTLARRADIATLQDLQGKIFGFVSSESTSGFMIPNFLLTRQGVTYNTFFGKHFFVGSHTRLIEALVAGSVDAGAVWSGEMKSAIETHGDVFRVLLESPPIPNSGIAIHPSVPADIQERIQKALINIPSELLRDITADGFVVKPDDFYTIIRDLETSKQ
jgi:phosphonate transport system substrate-binding protein